jgi:hypothetical protein
LVAKINALALRHCLHIYHKPLVHLVVEFKRGTCLSLGSSMFAAG